MFFPLIVGFLALTFFFERFLDLRQHWRFSDTEVPAPLRPYIDTADFAKAQNYGLARSSFSFVHTSFMFMHMLLILYLDAMPSLWISCESFVLMLSQRTNGWVSEYSSDSQGLTSILFFTAYVLYTTFIEIPFSLYSTFVIEEEFGFNKQSMWMFFKDTVKIQLITITIACPVIIVIIRLIAWGGETFWIYVWGFLTIVTLALVTIYPTFIAPLFNNYTQLPDGELRKAIYELANRKEIQFPLTEIYQVDGSTRSAHSNAYFYGFFKNKRIVIYDTLIEQVDVPGITAILGHELGHWKLSHTIKNLILSQLYLGLFLFIFGQFVHNSDLYTSFGFVSQPYLVGLTLFSLVYNPIDAVFGFLLKIMSRHFEYQADEYATRLGYDLTTPLAKIHAKNSSNMNPDPWYSTYHFSHPTLGERLAAIAALRSKTY